MRNNREKFKMSSNWLYILSAAAMLKMFKVPYSWGVLNINKRVNEKCFKWYYWHKPGILFIVILTKINFQHFKFLYSAIILSHCPSENLHLSKLPLQLVCTEPAHYTRTRVCTHASWRTFLAALICTRVRTPSVPTKVKRMQGKILSSLCVISIFLKCLAKFAIIE